MKLYCATYCHPDDGTLFIWGSSRAATEREARIRVKSLKDDDPERAETYEVLAVDAVEVPTDRKSLICWLGQHCSSDNG